jgi:hypothetical protein
MASPTPDDNTEPNTGSGLGRVLDTYFRTAASPDIEGIRGQLWTSSAEPSWSQQDPAYLSAVMDQYKIYVEMADRISSRRGLANTFFLSLNTAIFTIIGVFWQHPPHSHLGLLAIPLVVLIGQCLAWFWILRSYRQLNSAKYAVVGALEERLPASPYWAGEWAALGGGKDPARYWPLSHVESGIPAFFAAAYTVGFVVLLLS